ncbi:hypothetical protein EMPS_00887 [Entomortierella parvispora]|uniref:Transmembrane protein 198 n=1 Tax=Entomortierella parvispora TaxID=205924 RepID=A0A9P3H1T6_9FUNG|nr:hypothetical protein EMPS_00887 [Entomortierella parvispora]
MGDLNHGYTLLNQPPPLPIAAIVPQPSNKKALASPYIITAQSSFTNFFSENYNRIDVPLNWQRVIAGGVLMAVGLVLGIFGFRYLRFSLLLTGFIGGGKKIIQQHGHDPAHAFFFVCSHRFSNCLGLLSLSPSLPLSLFLSLSHYFLRFVHYGRHDSKSGIAAYAILYNTEPAGGWSNRIVIYVAVCIAAGLLIGLVLLAANKYASWILGGAGGLALGVYILSWREGGLIHNTGGRIGLMVGCAALGMILSLFLGNLTVIFGTVLIGGYMFTLGLDMFLRTGFLENYQYLFRTGNTVPYQIYSGIYGMLGVLSLSFVIGFLFQIPLYFHHRRNQRALARANAVPAVNSPYGYNQNEKRDSRYRDSQHRDSQYRGSQNRDSQYRDSQYRDSQYRDSQYRDSHYGGSQYGSRDQLNATYGTQQVGHVGSQQVGQVGAQQVGQAGTQQVAPAKKKYTWWGKRVKKDADVNQGGYSSEKYNAQSQGSLVQSAQQQLAQQQQVYQQSVPQQQQVYQQSVPQQQVYQQSVPQQQVYQQSVPQQQPVIQQQPMAIQQPVVQPQQPVVQSQQSASVPHLGSSTTSVGGEKTVIFEEKKGWFGRTKVVPKIADAASSTASNSNALATATTTSTTAATNAV